MCQINRNVAMYVRLSNEDTRSGSASLETQEKIIREKLESLPEYEAEEPLLFCDNGYSGRNLDRPAVENLLEMVKKNEIACIVIKDFSRLSRDMLQVGYLVESVFPLFQTRIISVNDGYDSADFYEDTGGLNVTFKYLLAEYYSRDLSRKIKAGKHSKIKRGEHVVNNPVFGYVLDENRRFAIDEGAAKIIRYIFKLAIEGNTVAEIRTNLYENKIPSRGEYKQYKLGQKYSPQPLIKGVWEHSCVMLVLRNEQYIGTYIGGRKVAKNDGTRACRNVPESEWVKIPDQHPPIIDKETFAKVQELFPKREKGLPKREKFPLKSKVFCGGCGHRLNRAGSVTMKFECKVGRDLSDFPCNDFSIHEVELQEKVLVLLKEEAKKILKKPKEEKLHQEVEAQEESAPVENFIARKKQLYEQMLLGEVTTEEYAQLKAVLDEEILTATSLHQKGGGGHFENKKNLGLILETKKEELLRTARSVRRSKKLTLDMCEKMIEKVVVFPDKTIEVIFMYENYNIN